MALFSFISPPRDSPVRERIADLAKRCGDLSPLREPVRQILINGNRERALRGVDPQGRRYAPLKPSTLERRTGSGPPLAPHYEQSRVIKNYEVDVTAGQGNLTFVAGWPTVPWMEYHQTGTPRMAARPPYGFTEQTLEQVRVTLRRHVVR